jgi:hypothetical protein
LRVVFYRESIARCRQNRWDFSLRVLVRTRSIMRKENIDLFKYYLDTYFFFSSPLLRSRYVSGTIACHIECTFRFPFSRRSRILEP